MTDQSVKRPMDIHLRKVKQRRRQQPSGSVSTHTSKTAAPAVLPAAARSYTISWSRAFSNAALIFSSALWIVSACASAARRSCLIPATAISCTPSPRTCRKFSTTSKALLPKLRNCGKAKLSACFRMVP